MAARRKQGRLRRLTAADRRARDARNERRGRARYAPAKRGAPKRKREKIIPSAAGARLSRIMRRDGMTDGSRSGLRAGIAHYLRQLGGS